MRPRESHLDFIDTPADLDAGTTTYDSMVVTEKNFFKSDGTQFNPATQKPLKVVVSCSKPYIGAWVGSFR